MKLGVCYYPEQWSPACWADDARRMAEMGLRVVRIAEFSWSRLEPRPGEFDWAALDQAVATLAEAGLQVVLGTPTAAPPRWLVSQHPEILPVDAQGRVKGFGSRRHCDFSSPAYHAASARIVEAMARRYGRHPAVMAWQTDNEYGCHDTTLSYSPAALRGFQAWLAQRYGDVATLNQRWGTVFWSMELQSFDEVVLPVGLPAQVNPIHALDFRRFASDEVRRFNRMQVDLLRQHAPGRPVLHNFMGFFGEFEHHALAQDLDIAAWDSYPLGATETAPFFTDADKLLWQRTGHPDVPGFHHDLYRGLCQGRLWVMEQQAGPVNWGAWNPVPLPGMVRAWTWEALAHGAELVSYFRWRQLPYAQEQMHSGLHTPDGACAPGGVEAAQVAQELHALLGAAALGQGDPAGQGVPQRGRAPVALVLDYSSQWMFDLQPQGLDFRYQALVFAWYSALRQLGLDVDIVPASADPTLFQGRALVLLPSLAVASEALVDSLAAAVAGGTRLVLGPRCGAKTENFAIPASLPPGPLARLLPQRVTQVDALRPGATVGVQAGPQPLGHVTQWRDVVEPGAGTQVLAHYADGHPALLQAGAVRGITGWLDPALLRRTLAQAASEAGLQPQPLPEGLRLSRCGPWRVAIHRGPGVVKLPCPPGTRFLLGGPHLAPAEVALWVEDATLPGGAAPAGRPLGPGPFSHPNGLEPA